MTKTNCSLRFLFACSLLGAAVGCGNSGGDANGDAGTSGPMRTGSSGDAMWTTETVETGNVGLHIGIAVTSDGPAIAYYASVSTEDGACGSGGTNRLLWPLRYAILSGDSITPETVADVLSLGQPSGLDLRADENGAPLLATITGEQGAARVCSANDLGLYRRSGGSWSVDVAVAESGEAATGMPASDFGTVVGGWPGLAISDSGEIAIAYKDTHAGSIQTDDFARADLEIAFGSVGSWEPVAIDPGRGAGTYNRVVFDSAGRPVVVYYNPTEATDTRQQGIWAARRETGSTDWTLVRLTAGATKEGPDVIARPDGRIHVAYYDARRGVPRIMTLTDSDRFDSVNDGWTEETIGDSRFDEGYEASLAIDSEGRLAVAYYRCGRAVDGLGECSNEHNGLVFAWQDERDAWVVEEVTDDDALCGNSPALAFDSDGSPIIAYRCQAVVEGNVDDQVRVARRMPL